MRTSLTDIRDAEMYLKGTLGSEESLVFEARLLTNAELKSNLNSQRTLYQLLTVFQRKKIKDEVLKIHSQVFGPAGNHEFQDSVLRIFNQ